MNTEKAAYWFAGAILALGLHSEYRNGAFPAIHQATSRAGVTLSRFAAHAERAAAMAKLLTVRPALVQDDLVSGSDARESRLPLLAGKAHIQAETLRRVIRDRAQLGRDQARQAQIIRAQFLLQPAQIEEIHRTVRLPQASTAISRQVVLVCPRTGARIAVETADGVSDLGMNSPDTDVTDTF